MTDDPVVTAALAQWEHLARFAWRSFRARGRGVALVARADLSSAPPPVSWVPLDIIPRGDDFYGVLKRYDPTTQVPLLVGDDDGERLLMLESAGVRPTPEQLGGDPLDVDPSQGEADGA